MFIDKPIVLFVDEMTEDRTFGYTEDINKINQNINIVGGEFKKERNEIPLSKPEVKTWSVNNLGIFLCVMFINGDKSEGKMWLFDHTVKKRESFKDIMEGFFIEKIADDCMQYYDALIRDFTDFQDLVRLTVPTKL